MEVFAATGERKNKLVLLVTDGEDFSLSLEAVQQKASQVGVKLLSWGIGSEEGAPVPILDAEGKLVGSETDEKGAIILSKLNEPMLKAITSTLNGLYVRARYDDQDIDELISRLNRFEKEQLGDHTISLFEDQYPWFLAVVWVLLALEWIL